MNLVSIIFVCYLMAAITVFGIPAWIHQGVVSIRNHTGKDWSLLLFIILMVYLAFVLLTLCVGFYSMYVRFFL